MRKIILVYGAIAGGIVIFIIIASLLWAGTESLHTTSPLLGYVIMIAAFSLVFFGIKTYRDEHLGGAIRFGNALVVGLGITAVASLVYVLGWELYLFFTESNFMELYIEAELEQMKTGGASLEALAEARENFNYYREIYRNPFLRMGITLTEIFPVGLVITFISAGLLKNSEFLPAEPTRE